MIPSIKNAEPMTLHRYNLLMNKQHISQPYTQGYKLEFEDGYVTWCPKDVYDKIYIPSGLN